MYSRQSIIRLNWNYHIGLLKNKTSSYNHRNLIEIVEELDHLDVDKSDSPYYDCILCITLLSSRKFRLKRILSNILVYLI